MRHGEHGMDLAQSEILGIFNGMPPTYRCASGGNFDDELPAT